MKQLVIALAISVLLMPLFTADLQAHESRPLTIHISESDDGIVRLSWSTPPSVISSGAPVITLSGCNSLKGANVSASLSANVLYTCPEELSRHDLLIEYPLFNPSVSAIVQIEFSNGEKHSVVMSPEELQLDIPNKESFGGIAKSYFELGVQHILSGFDHLLFLAGLLYIARTPSRTFMTVTGFTLAHSLTIFLVALGVTRVSIPAVEIVIAFSIVFLATEIARNRRDTLTWNRPILVASTFGLVHGAGFAAALTEIGLPQTQRINALIFFNLGVEAGQIFIVLIIFLIAALVIAMGPAKTFFEMNQKLLRHAFSYFLGVLSAFWFIERIANALL
jgi:hydrogenase/urease accessory protein HupE